VRVGETPLVSPAAVSFLMGRAGGFALAGFFNGELWLWVFK